MTPRVHEVGCGNRTRLTFLVIGITILLGVPAPVLSAGGGGGGGGGAAVQGSDRQQRAIASYQRGEKARNRGIEYLQEAAELTDPEAKQEALDKADKQWKRALKEFKKAVRSNRKFHQAYNEIGFSERMLGNYEAALEAYDKALELEPGFPHAIEYRGEAYMRLGRLEDAKTAYMALFADHRELADLLLKKMRGWVKLQEREPGKVPAEQLEAFAGWVAERSEIAQQTAALTGGEKPRSW